MKKETVIIIVSVALLFGLGEGYLVGQQIGSEAARENLSARIDKAQAQYDKAKKIFPQTPQDMRNIQGTVRSVDGDVVSVDTPPNNPLDELPAVRKIAITPDTKIIIMKQKDPATFRQEMKAYQETLPSKNGAGGGSDRPLPPQPFDDVPGSLSDIKPGQLLIAIAGENIREKESFAAATIRISGLASSAQ